MIGAKDSRILRTHVVPARAADRARLHDAADPGQRAARGRHHVPRRRDQPAHAELGQPAVGRRGAACSARRRTTAMRSQVWLTLLPSLMIFITVFTFNQLGEGLREAFDPEAQAVMARFVLVRVVDRGLPAVRCSRLVTFVDLRDDPGRAGRLPRRPPARDAGADRRRASGARARPLDLLPLRRVHLRTSLRGDFGVAWSTLGIGYDGQIHGRRSATWCSRRPASRAR